MPYSKFCTIENHQDFLKLLDPFIFEIATITTESYFLFKLLGE